MKRTLLLAFCLLGGLAGAAAAKPGAQAHLVSPLPAQVGAGNRITITWTVDVPDESGNRIPFGAIGMFVRLVGRNGARTQATAPQTSGPFTVRLRVPRGGIRTIRFGLHGSSDIFFPLK
jgi:hypothetical protein